MTGVEEDLDCSKFGPTNLHTFCNMTFEEEELATRAEYREQTGKANPRPRHSKVQKTDEFEEPMDPAIIEATGTVLGAVAQRKHKLLEAVIGAAMRPDKPGAKKGQRLRSGRRKSLQRNPNLRVFGLWGTGRKG